MTRSRDSCLQTESCFRLNVSNKNLWKADLQEVARYRELSREPGGQVLERQPSELEVVVSSVYTPLKVQGVAHAMGGLTDCQGGGVGVGAGVLS